MLTRATFYFFSRIYRGKPIAQSLPNQRYSCFVADCAEFANWRWYEKASNFWNHLSTKTSPSCSWDCLWDLGYRMTDQSWWMFGMRSYFLIGHLRPHTSPTYSHTRHLQLHTRNPRHAFVPLILLISQHLVSFAGNCQMVHRESYSNPVKISPLY